MVEDLSVFFADFGVTATFGAESGKVLFENPQMVVDTMSVDTNYAIIYPATMFTTLSRNSIITIDGVAYRVNYINAIEDGKLKRADLEKP